MVIEWRPLESKWFPSSENWRISTPEDPIASSLVLKGRRLVDPKSATAETIYKWLKPLESSPKINIYYNGETNETEACLPRMNLDFILRKAGLESKQFRGMFVDTNQHIGAWHGLLNKLVLKDPEIQSRVVIVPHGTVTHRRVDHHVQVSISTELGDKIPYHQFVIDKVRTGRTFLSFLRSECLKRNSSYFFLRHYPPS